MPKFDKTGPAGAGPKTGKGLGSCGPGIGFGLGSGAGFGPGMGFGQRRGARSGRGMGRYFGCWNSPQTKEDQVEALTDYRKALEEELEDVKEKQKELS